MIGDADEFEKRCSFFLPDPNAPYLAPLAENQGRDVDTYRSLVRDAVQQIERRWDAAANDGRLCRGCSVTVRYLSSMPSYSVAVADNEVIIMLDGPLGRIGAAEGFYSFFSGSKSSFPINSFINRVDKESHPGIAFEKEVR